MTCPKLLSKTVHHTESHLTSLAFTPTCLRSISSCPSPSNFSSIGTPWICIYYYIYFQSVPFNLVMHHLMRHFSRIQKNLNDYNQCVWIVFLQKLWKIWCKHANFSLEISSHIFKQLNKQLANKQNTQT